VTDEAGVYRFTTVRPGAYPWGNHPQCLAAEPYPPVAVRRQYRLAPVTQMFFPGDPLLDFDPIFQGTPRGRATG
jgi:protocatechuate 3,4-dioxygenase, beta subunit